jgi:hypothetical protein
MDGTPVQTEQKLNNPNNVRRDKRFFASDFQLVKNSNQEGTFLENFTVQDALKLNKMDKPNAVAVERGQPRPRPIIRAVLPLPIARQIIRPVVARQAQSQPEIDPLIGKYVQKTFQGYSKTLFKGKIVSYDSIRKFYKVEYEDNSIEEYTKLEINKYLIKQVLVGGKIYLL